MGRRQPMIHALARLHGLDPGEMPQALKAMGISARPSGWMAWFSSHPPMEARIERLQQLA
jgi:heat shock protein HtpX